MKKKAITLKSFVTKCEWMFDYEKELVFELLRDGNILFGEDKLEEMKDKYSSLLVWDVVRFRELENHWDWRLWVVEINC